jgi:hypothetical protein
LQVLWAKYKWKKFYFWKTGIMYLSRREKKSVPGQALKPVPLQNLCVAYFGV